MRQDTVFKFLRYSLTWGRIHCFLCDLRITEGENTHLEVEGILIYDHLRKIKSISRSACLNFCDPTDFCPWNYPAKNTGVGSHFLLQGSSWPRNGTQVSCYGREILYCLSHQGSLKLLVLSPCVFSRCCLCGLQLHNNDSMHKFMFLHGEYGTS